MRLRGKIRGRLRALVPILLLLAALTAGHLAYLSTHRPLPRGEVELRFLDVGQGDASLIVTPEGCVLIDAGGRDTAETLYYSVNMYGGRLACLIVTHPHEDHMGGAAYLLEKMRVGAVILPRTVPDDDAYRRFLTAVEDSGADVLYAEPGLVFVLGGARFTVLAPLVGYEDENDGSAVIRMDYGQVSALFTGDASAESETDQLSRYGTLYGGALDVDILKVGHHGSATSSTDAYLAALTPRCAVISCGKNNAYGHPSSAVLERLARAGCTVFRTDRDGTVTLVTDGKSIRSAS